MKFTTPDGKPVTPTDPAAQPETSKVEETAKTATPSTTEEEAPKPSMTFHGNTAQIDTRKGMPALLEDTATIEARVEQEQRRGCFFWGCMTVVWLLLLLILIILWTVRAFKNKITPYLGDKELPIPAIVLDTETISGAQTKLEQLQGKQPLPAGEEIVITAQELNQFVEQYKVSHNLPAKWYIIFPSENNAVVYGTMPLDKRTKWLFKDKWLNAIVQLSGNYQDSLLDLHIVKINLDSQDVTELYKSTSGSLRINPPTDQETINRLARFEKIYVSDNKLHFDIK